MNASAISATRIVRVGDGFECRGQVHGLTLDQKKEDFVSASWGFLDFDSLGVDKHPSLEDVDRRFEQLGLRRAVVFSKNHNKEKKGIVAERAHFLFPFAATQFICPGSAVHKVVNTGKGLEVVEPKPLISKVPLLVVPSVANAIEHCRTMPPSISGSEGRFPLYSVANVLIHEDGLSVDEATKVILQFFNPRCLPPWTEDKIRQNCIRSPVRHMCQDDC